jgi:hypothetical protein
VAFWATVVVVVLVAYPLSYGPACWLIVHLPRAMGQVLLYVTDIVYLPISRICDHSEAVNESMNWYAGLWL